MSTALVTSLAFTHNTSKEDCPYEVLQETISAESLARVAEEELRETASTRNQCLEQFREWIMKNPDISNCILDDNFLLRFLRVKKYSIPMAQQILLKYLNFRKVFSHIYDDLDCLDEKINELITNGYIFASPFRDANGRRVMIYNLNKFDPSKFSGTDMARVHILAYEALIADEETQILGVHHVGDTSGVTPEFATLFSVTEFARLLRWGEQSFPMRHKAIDIVKVPAVVKYIYEFAKSNMSQKLKTRLMIHDSLESLHAKVDTRCLPAEFGGTMKTEDMISLWKQELLQKRERILSLESIKLLSDQGIISRKKNPAASDETGEGSLAGSFRKLDID